MEIMVVNPYLTDAAQSRKTWDGGGADDNWSTPQNWVGDVAPVANDPLIFAGVVRLNPVNDIAADTAFNGITFNPTSGAFTLSGNRFNLNGGIKNNAAAPNTQKVSNDFIINSTQYVGTDVSSGTRLELDGVISGAGELHVQSANPFQNIFLNGLNTFTGKVRHCECNLWANTLADSGLPCSIGAGSLLELYAVTVDPYFFYSGPTVAFNRPIACINGGYHTTRIQITTGGAVVTFNGVISGDANLDISFPVAGTSVLNGANTITGKISARAQATIQSPTIADIGIPCGFGTGTEVGAFGVNTTVEYTGPTASTNKIISGSGTFKVSVSPVWNALILSGVSTLTGPIIINTGTLIVGNAVVDGSISTASGITNNSRLYYRPIGSVTYANVISGTGTVEKNGPGTLTLSGANTYTGQTLITNGTLSINSIKNVGGGASAIGAPTTAANGTITLGSTATDPCTLVYTGTGDTTNRVIRMYSLGADMTIDQSGSGLLKFTSTLESVAAFNKTLVLQGSTVGTGEISGVIPNTDIFNLVGLSKRGTGTWTLSGANTFTGGTTINGGVLSVTTSNNAIGAGGTVTINSGATRLLIQDLRTISRPIVINGGAPGAGRGLIENSGFAFATLSGAITINGSTSDGVHFGSFSLAGGLLTINTTITSSVPVTMRGFIGLDVAGSNYTSLVMTEGQVRTNVNNGIATNATLTLGTVGAGTFNTAGKNQSLVGIVKGAFSAIIGNISITADSLLTLTGSCDWAGVIQDAIFGGTRKIAVTINSSGTVTFGGANTYTGATTISAGILTLTGSMGNTAVSVNAGGTFTGPTSTGATATVTGTVTVADSATAIIQPGSFGDNVLNTGALTFSGVNAKMISNSTASTFSKIAATGNVALGGCTIDFPAGITVDGTYKLITATGVMSGVLPVVGANATGKALALQQTGNDLEVVVS